MISNSSEKSSLDRGTQDPFLETFKDVDTETIISYLRLSHEQYRKTRIPEIEQNFIGLLKLLPNEPSLNVIFNLFVKFQISLELHMQIEEEKLYPEILRKGTQGKELTEEFHSHEEPFLTEIISCLRRQGYVNNPFCQILIHRLVHFDEELRTHALIEDQLI